MRATLSILLVLFSTSLFGQSRLTIESADPSSTSISISYSSKQESVQLNKGVGYVNLDLDQPTFVFLPQVFTHPLLFEPGADLKIILRENRITFSDSLGNLNEALIRGERLSDSLLEKGDWENNDPYIIDETLNSLCKRVDMTALNPSGVSLMEMHFRAKLAAAVFWSTGQIDSLLLSDTLLLPSGSTYIMNFLTWVNARLLKDLPRDRLLTISADSVLATIPYLSSQVQEYLRFDNLVSTIYAKGLSVETERFVNHLELCYPHTAYRQRVQTLLSEFAHLRPGHPSADFELTTVDNRHLSLNQFQGRKVLIDVWATWCAPCTEKLPTVEKLQEKYPDLNVIYVNLDQDVEVWKQFLRSHKLRTRSHFHSGSQITEMYKITGIPRLILLDESGAILDAFVTDLDQIESYLKP